jgi:hypothetical protein
VARLLDRSIDTLHSILKIRVFKSGVFSAFAHDHQIEPPFADGIVHFATNPSLVFSVHARDLRVRDPDVSPAQRADIQGTMTKSPIQIAGQGLVPYPELV